jgi:hypothetical protein
LAPGETAIIALSAPDRKQAALLLDYTRAILTGSDLLRAEIIGETADSIELRHATRVEVLTSSYRSIRGRSIAVSILDECSFLRSDESAVPDVELYRALLPSMLTLRGKLFAISSPHMRRGLMYELYGRYFAKDDARGLYVQAASVDLNPSLDRDAIDRAIAADPEAGKSEWGGLYRSDLSAYLPSEDIDRAVVQHRRSLPASYNFRYFAFCDPSGGRSDSMTLGVSHMEGTRVILDRLVSVAPPFTPEDVVVRFCEVLSSFGLNRVVGDQYGGEWIATAFARHSVAYVASELSASEIYCEAAHLFSAGLVELLDIPSLRVELSLLERRPRPGGRGDSVDHPRNAHDDQAVSAVGSLLLAATAMSSSRDDSAASIGHALRDHDPLAAPVEIRPAPRHLPDAFGMRFSESYGTALRDHDIF